MDIEGRSFVSLLRLYTLPIFFGVVSFSFILVSLVLFIKSVQSSEPIVYTDRQGAIISEFSNEASGSASAIKISVDVEGSVVNPGVITLQTGSRVEDALKMAGGLKKDADFDYISVNINKAMKLTDGMKIYIPSKTETSHSGDCTTSQNGIDVAQSCGVVATLGKSSQNTTRISINMATLNQLDTLSGIGPVTAQKIIDNRPYQTLEELVSKKAVGQSVFEKIKPFVDL